MHPEMPFLREVILLLAVAGLAIPIMHRLRLNPVLGFLCVGLGIGPHGLARLVGEIPALEYLVIPDAEGVRRFAELGVVFLLFTIGLELSMVQLWTMRRLVFGLGAAQVLLTSIAIGGIAYAFGNSLAASTMLGLCLALSSTAFVVQLLTERLQLNTPLGRTSFGVLLFQDLAVVPILFLVGVFGAKTEGSLALPALRAVGTALLVIATILVLGRLLVRPMLRFASRSGSRDVFMAAVLFLILGTAALTALAGLSMALGAFLAGLLFAGTEYRHQVKADIEPFKGLLLGLFFVAVGMQLDPAAVWSEFGWAAVSVLGLITLKSAILCGLALAFRLSLPVAVEAGLLLSQGGEFAFVVVGAALAAALLSPATAQFMLMVVVVTMFLSPAVASLGRRVARSLDKQLGHSYDDDLLASTKGHVLIGGFGRVGQLIARLLEAQRIPYVALDTDPDLVARLRSRGAPVFYGDASQPEVLAHVGIAQASAFVATMDQADLAEHVVVAVGRTWSHLTISARARDAEHARQLMACGAAGVVPETTEASLQLAEKVLIGVGLPEEIARSIIEDQRIGPGAAAGSP